ncbi:MAG: DUF3108 domain-containing protein, partial [Rhodospirillales bacterium]|nr:DUF3108 domain-containing protein [Rhodospirillales bacterium]
MMRRLAVLALAALFATPARAALPVPRRITDARLDYVAYSHGLAILHFRVILALWPGGYRMRLAYRTSGVVGFFYRGHQLDAVAGTWKDGRPAPRLYRADGVWHGGVHRLRLIYRDGVPHVAEVLPPISKERHPVPKADQRGTVDTLTAVVDLLRRLAGGRSCDDSVRTFDGRRLGVIAAREAGSTRLARTGRSIFAGAARRCDFTGRMLAGFLYGHRARDSRPLHGSAWFARLAPGGPRLPVHLRF